MADKKEAEKKKETNALEPIDPEAAASERPCDATTEKMLKSKGYEIGSYLNYGSFARVYRATYKGKNIACKVISTEKTSEDYKTRFLPRELEAVKKLNHPHIIRVYHVFDIRLLNKTYIFMEWAEKGDLLEQLNKQNGPLPLLKARKWFKQISMALKYIHSMGFGHRDLKCENVLIATNDEAKLTDFGFVRRVFDPVKDPKNKDLSKTFCGSLDYTAPEVLKFEKYDPILSDCWSMGVILHVMLNNRMPFETTVEAKKMLKQQLDKKIIFNPKVINSINRHPKDLILKLLEVDTRKRLTMTQVLLHPWFESSSGSSFPSSASPAVPPPPSPSPPQSPTAPGKRSNDTGKAQQPKKT